VSGLRDRVVVVTGAAGGIGVPLCRLLASHGCRLGLVGRTAATLEALADELRQGGTVAAVQAADVGDQAAVNQALAAIRTELGPVDVLVHNAGLARVTQARAPDLDDLEQMVRVNYLGGVYLVAAVLPDMLARGSGQIIGVSSLSAIRGLAWTAGYSASKAAFAVYLESLRPALRRRGIRVSTVFPGFVRTPMALALPWNWPVPMLRPEAAARRVFQAMVRGRREVWFPWLEAGVSTVLRRLPNWAFDLVMAHAARFSLKGEY
jgi:short-subunit dehydrogenase